MVDEYITQRRGKTYSLLLRATLTVYAVLTENIQMSTAHEYSQHGGKKAWRAAFPLLLWGLHCTEDEAV